MFSEKEEEGCQVKRPGSSSDIESGFLLILKGSLFFVERDY